MGKVSGNNYVGGFGGQTGSSVSLSLTNCFSAGTVFCENPQGEELCGAFIGSFSALTNFTDCYFDRQTVGLETIAETEDIGERLTSELTKTELPGFDNDTWVLKSGYYPQLKVFVESDDAATQLHSALSVVPLRLAGDTETVDAVRTSFRLADKTPAGDDVIWSTESSEMVTIVNNVVYAFKSDEWRTLTLRAGDAERAVQFRSNNDLITADILDIKVNNAPVAPADIIKINNTKQFTYTIRCTEKELETTSVFVEITLGGFITECTPATSMMLFADQPPQTVTVTTANNLTETYTFEVEKYISPDIFIQRWADVLAINNNSDTNGGYDFTDYQWFRNGVKLLDTKGYIRLSGPGEYTATLSGRFLATQQIVTRTTCPAELSNTTPIAAVYPNPVLHGQAVHFETGMGRDGACPVSTMQLFDATGNIVAKQTVHDPVVEITMPDTPGQYILQVTVNGVGQTFKIVVE